MQKSSLLKQLKKNQMILSHFNIGLLVIFIQKIMKQHLKMLRTVLNIIQNMDMDILEKVMFQLEWVDMKKELKIQKKL